jgi:hypothetical protein
VTVLDPRSSTSPGPGGPFPWRQWSAPELRVDARGPVPAGIDGEAAVLDPPVVFRVRPAALRVRIAAGHPGASPSAVEPVGALSALGALGRIAARPGSATAGACGTAPAHRPLTANGGRRRSDGRYLLGCGSSQSILGLTPT